MRFGIERLFYRRPDGGAVFFPAKWTDQCSKDPFLELARGKAVARPRDLLELARLVREMIGEGVRQNTPHV